MKQVRVRHFFSFRELSKLFLLRSRLAVTNPLSPCPLWESKRAIGRQRQIRSTFSISSVEEDCVAPPIWKAVARIANSEEDNDATQSRAGIECSSEDVVVLGPPREELRHAC